MPIRKSRNLTTAIKKNAPKIFKVVGAIGLFLAPVLTVPATVKSVRACDKKKEELGVEKLTWKEILKTSWKNYIPVGALMGASTASMIKGEGMDAKRTAFMAAACNMAEKTLADYKEETVKKIGESKAKEIERDVLEKEAQTKIKEVGELGIQCKGNGGVLFYEPITGTLFYSTRNKVDKAFNDLSAQMLREDTVDLGDLFGYLGLRRVDACHGYGWNSTRTKTVEPDYMWFGDEETGIAYTIMGYRYYPTTNFLPPR